MPFAMFCVHKGCKGTVDQMEPYLDPNTDKVYCSRCDQELPNITHFVKVQMKQLKQFRAKQAVAFGTKCKSCGKEAQPVIVGDDIVCPGCKKPHTHLSEPFKRMLKDKLKTANKEVT